MKKTVAIFPSGTEIGLEINNALRFSKDIDVIGLSSAKDHTEFIYDKYYSDLPFYDAPDFIDKINKRIALDHIDFIYPAHDDALLFLTKNAQKIQARIITSALSTVEICRSKQKTYEYFRGENFIPEIYSDPDNVPRYPVFIKPDIGQGSQGAKIVKSKHDLEHEIRQNNRVVICEYLPGQEYTVDCFTDVNGELIIANLRDRKRIKNGISVNSKHLPPNDEVQNIANKINHTLKFNGAWFFQLKRSENGLLKLLEIAPRVAGTMGLTRNMGINLPLLTIYNNIGIKTSIIRNEYDIEVDRALISRYKIHINYSRVYIDLDDTIIVDGKVNKVALAYLYQLSTDGVESILITRHAGDILDTLEKYKIAKELFSKIIRIDEADEKYKYMKAAKAIFIDDSFRERQKVHEELGMPVFDVDEIEALIDWRN